MCDTVSQSEINIITLIIILASYDYTRWASKRHQTLPSVKTYNQFHLANEI